MASNLDLNVIISASFEKLKKGMADAVNVVKGSTKKMEEAAAGSKKALEQALGGENLRVKRRELTVTINEQRSILTSFKQDLIALENKLAQTSKGDLMRQKALKNAIASLKVEIKDQEAAVRQLSDARAETNFNLEEGSRKAEQNTQAMEAMSRAINAASMATLLLAGGNEKISKIMRGVQVAMALASAAVAVYNLAQRQNEIFTKASAVAQTVFTAAVGASTGAVKALRIALIASGAGAILVGLGFLIEKFVSLSDEVASATNAVSDFQKEMEAKAIADVRWENEKLILALQKRGATEEEIAAQVKQNAINEQTAIRSIIRARARANQDLTELNEQYNEVGKAFKREELEREIRAEEKKREEQKKTFEKYKEWLKEKAALEEAMNKNLTQFLIDEEVKRVKERNKAREMTEADLMPAGVAPTLGIIGAPGEGPFDTITESANTASDAVTNFATKFREATRGLKMDIEAQQRKAQELADSWAAAMEVVSQAVTKMANDAVYAFGVLVGDLVTGQKDALKVFTSGFIGAIAGFLETFGKALIQFGVGLQAFQIAIESMNPAVALVAGAGLIATAQILRNVVQSGVPAFADGGIVSGPTLGLMGEYPGARSNPEVIAPLDKLQSMINTGGGSGELVASTRFDGRDLWLAVNRYEKDKSRG